MRQGGTTGGGGTEDFAIVPATISAMFVQSYQTNVHVFPNWPMDQDASFGNLNACGGFLVSSEVKEGKVSFVMILSNAGQECRSVSSELRIVHEIRSRAILWHSSPLAHGIAARSRPGSPVCPWYGCSDRRPLRPVR